MRTQDTKEQTRQQHHSPSHQQRICTHQGSRIWTLYAWSCYTNCRYLDTINSTSGQVSKSLGSWWIAEIVSYVGISCMPPSIFSFSSYLAWKFHPVFYYKGYEMIVSQLYQKTKSYTGKQRICCHKSLQLKAEVIPWLALLFEELLWLFFV